MSKDIDYTKVALLLAVQQQASAASLEALARAARAELLALNDAARESAAADRVPTVA